MCLDLSPISKILSYERICIYCKNPSKDLKSEILGANALDMGYSDPVPDPETGCVSPFCSGVAQLQRLQLDYEQSTPGPHDNATPDIWGQAV